jgi:hypothetical protein
MIQRVLYSALKAGLAAIQKDPDILKDVFDWQLDLANPEVNSIQQFFAEKPPNLYHGYARADYKFPLYSIVLQSEAEKDLMIGDDAGMITDEEDPNTNADMRGAFWHHSYEVLCYSEHPDATQYMYEVAKAILLQAGPYFVNAGLHGIRISGMDLRPDPQYIPEHLFVRRLVFECENAFVVVDRESRLSKAFRLSGLFVDNSGSSSDVGEVHTNIYPYVDGTEEE